jgi:hypothetical protein
VARLLLFGSLPMLAALTLAGLAFALSGTTVAAQDCPSGTIPFHFQIGVPIGTFDVGDLPADLPPGITITVEPSEGGDFDLVVVVACVTPPPPGSGDVLLPGVSLLFTTPTPGAPVRFLTPTPTPPATATAAVQPTAAAVPVTGIRPPSTGDGGLAGASVHAYPALVALLVLCAGLAIGAASFRLRAAVGRIPESGRRRD